MVPVFGFYRWVLACMVMYSHVGLHHHPCGSFAVYGFFILSGYLMTMVLKEVYGGSLRGIGAFYINRALRIYPMYWLAMWFGVMVLASISYPILDGEIVYPSSTTLWVRNIGLFSTITGSWILSVAWSLLVEVWFYALMPLLVLNRTACRIWLLGSLCLLVWLFFAVAPFNDRYLSVYGASPAFALGAFIYLARARLRPVAHWLGALCIFVMLVVSCYPMVFLRETQGYSFYMMMLLNGLIVAYLSRQNVSRSSLLWRVDTFMGKLSFPVFLFHLPLTEVMRLLVDPYIAPSFSMPFFLVCFVAVNGVGVLAHYGVEVPIGLLRDKLRPARGPKI